MPIDTTTLAIAAVASEATKMPVPWIGFHQAAWNVLVPLYPRTFRIGWMNSMMRMLA